MTGATQKQPNLTVARTHKQARRPLPREHRQQAQRSLHSDPTRAQWTHAAALAVQMLLGDPRHTAHHVHSPLGRPRGTHTDPCHTANHVLGPCQTGSVKNYDKLGSHSSQRITGHPRAHHTSPSLDQNSSSESSGAEDGVGRPSSPSLLVCRAPGTAQPVPQAWA